MRRDHDESSMSELEAEYELEMDNELDYEGEYEGGSDDAEREFEEEFEGEFEGDSESDNESEYESDYESSDAGNSNFAERLFELAQMEFESEFELDQELEAIVDNMAENFSFKKFKKFGKRFLNSRLGKMAMGAIPGSAAIKGVTSLLNGDLKGLAGAAVSSFVPGAAPALTALGFEAGEPEANREAWDNYVEVADEAFENAAGMLDESAVDPMVAHEIAKQAFGKAMKTVTARVAARRRAHKNPMRRPSGIRFGGDGGTYAKPKARRRVVHLRPGEYLVVIRTKS